jgi:hypothetical protein
VGGGSADAFNLEHLFDLFKRRHYTVQVLGVFHIDGKYAVHDLVFLGFSFGVQYVGFILADVADHVSQQPDTVVGPDVNFYRIRI